MDDLARQNPDFAGSAASSATPERNLDAGVLETIQEVLGRADLDGLARILADRVERLVALMGLGAEPLDVNRLGRPAQRLRRVDRSVHQSRRTAGVEVRPLRLPTDERRDVEFLPQAVVVEMDVRVVLEPQEGDEGGRTRRCGRCNAARRAVR